jgi:hypothetical protein
LPASKPELLDLRAPTQQSPPNAAVVSGGPWLAPKKRIYFYSAGEWEEFILEWAHVLDDPYAAVKQFGGANDHGIDVAAMLSDQGLQGEWDCYQCKHYEQPLTPGLAKAEIIKIFLGVIDGHYVMPRKYRFLAPRGCGAALTKLLSSPSKLKDSFLDEAKQGKALVAGLDHSYIKAIREFSEKVDFSIFDSEDIDEVIQRHKKHPHHVPRFGGPLPARPKPALPPAKPSPMENRYVEQLMEVYSERYGVGFTPEMAASHESVTLHYPRQREAFYSAEALRVFARDSVPSGTFESLQDEVYDGVVEICERDNIVGYERLTQVLQAAVEAQITSNALISVTVPRDRKGICHQLANEDRLIWVRRA